MEPMIDLKIVRDHVTREELRAFAEQRYGDMVKAVVDLKRHVMAVGGEMHADEEQALLDDGSKQEDLWGINLYHENYPQPSWIEFDSMINIRPRQQNRSRGVEDASIQQAIRTIAHELVKD